MFQEQISKVEVIQRDIQANQLARATRAPTLHNYFCPQPRKKQPQTSQQQPTHIQKAPPLG